MTSATHPHRSLRSGALVATVAGLVLAGLLLVGPAGASESRSCAWVVKADPAGANVLYPDEAAHYWFAAVPLLPGQHLEVRGRYPHSRYFSLTSYDPAVRSADGIADHRIRPDAGSTNPFLWGADRTAAKRSWSVQVQPTDRPATPARNTLYTGSTDGSRSNRVVEVIYRNYRQDRGLQDDGGVGLPSIAVVGPGGTTTLPGCEQPTVPPNDVNETAAQSSPPAPLPATLGTTQPVWRKFYNLPTSAGYAASTPYTGSTVGESLEPLTSQTAPGGFADNPDNKYVATIVDSGISPVVVIRATLPTTPRTYAGQRRMQGGQLRYWSMCSNEFATGRFYDCLVDDEVPVADDGTFTLVVSTAAERPVNARPACGIAWLPMGPAVDTLLIERTMLPAAGFAHSIQAARQGHEREDLGAYYPRTRYTTRAAVERLGCTRS